MSYLIAGCILFFSTAATSFLSRSFVYGEGHPERPIGIFLALCGVSFAAYFFVLEKTRVRPPRPGWIFLVAVLCRVAFFPSQPIQEDDPYRYYWDGQQVLHGNNPYLYAPEDIPDAPPGYQIQAGPGAAEVFERINYPHVRTIYPPLAQGAFALGQLASPWQAWGWKIIVLAAEIIHLGLLWLLLRATRLPAGWLVLYAWSPLVLKEFSNSLHVDVLAVLFLTTMAYALARGRTLWAFAALAGVTLVKWFGAALLPLLVVWVWQKDKKNAIKGLSLFTGVVALAWLPYAAAGRHLFEGLGTFAAQWRVNDSLYSLIHAGFSLLPLEGEALRVMSRTAAGLLFCGVTGFVLKKLSGRTEVKDFFKGCMAVLACLFFLAPTGNPWYFTWVLPLLVFCPLRSLVLFSGLVFLYYLDFYFMYRGAGESFVWVRVVEYGLFVAALTGELWIRKRRSASLSRS